MLSRAQNTFHHNPRLRGPVSSNDNRTLYFSLKQVNNGKCITAVIDVTQ